MHSQRCRLESAMSEMQTKPKRISVGIKIELSKDNSELLKTLLSKANSEIKGSTLNYGKLCNWLFSQHPDNLTEDELEGLRKQFHSEKAYAKWMFEEIARAESEGRPIPTIEQLMSGKPIVKPHVRKPRKPKKVLDPENDSQDSTAEASSLTGNTPSAIADETPSRGRL
jgi:hypothetical protein